MSGPSAFINEHPRSLAWYKDGLMLRGHAYAKFDQLNAHLGFGLRIKPGELVIIGDDSTSLCTPMDRQLMSYAQDVNRALMLSDDTSAHVLVQNYDFLQKIMTYGSIGIGSATSGWATHLNGVESTLKDINTAYQQWRSGTFNKDQFVARRQELFKVLDGQLRGIGRWGTGLRNNSTIKKMLGISSKNYWLTGEIPNYVKNVKRINNVARNLAYGTPVGVALDLGAGAMEIGEACSTGREQECTRAKFVEVGKMMVGIPAAGWVGGLSGKAGLNLCVKMIGPSRGASIAVCGIAAASAGGWAAGEAGTRAGGGGGTMLYEIFADE